MIKLLTSASKSEASDFASYSTCFDLVALVYDRRMRNQPYSVKVAVPPGQECVGVFHPFPTKVSQVRT